MLSMKRLIPYLLCVLFGTLMGWYYGYTRPVAVHYRELLKEYHEVLGQTHLTDKEMAELGTKLPQYFEDVKRLDEMAAAMALSAYYLLEEGDIESAKKWLTRAIGSYYCQYHD